MKTAEIEERINPMDFTYSKLIFRDKNGIPGKNTTIKELKYVPVCDKSISRRKASRQAKEDELYLSQSKNPTPLTVKDYRKMVVSTKLTPRENQDSSRINGGV